MLAKPTGISLEEHVQNVQQEAGRILEVRPNLAVKYARLTGHSLRELLEVAVQWHDEGKKDKQWQEPCQKDFAAYNSMQDKDKTGFRAKHLQKAGIRHEMASLDFTKNKSLNPIVKVAIAAHHSKLDEGEKHRWLEHGRRFKAFWDEFINIQDIDCDYEELLEQSILKRYECSAVRSLLQIADRRASAIEDEQYVPEIKSFSYTFPYKDEHGKPTLRGVQKVIAQIQDLPFAILRAPTGAGKTDASLLWAKHQIDSGKADRMIIAMPTRFTANSLSISVADSLGSSGLYHSTAFYQKTKDVDELTEELRKEIKAEQDLARLLVSPVTVCTIDHLLMCLTGTKEDHHTTFFNLANSCLVIDEADFYDTFTQGNIISLLRVLRLLEVPVLLMSATVPDSMIPVYATSGFAIEKIYDVVETAPETPIVEKTRVKIGERLTVTDAQSVSHLLEKAFTEPTIIYANTVKRAQMYYKHLQNLKPEYKIVIYHSRFTEPDKAEKEKQLLEMMGKEAWQAGTAHGIAILTQIGEISVNISANQMISEWCPIDRLIQRIGRLSRFENIIGDGNGILHLLSPMQENGQTYPAPYGRYRKSEGWIPSTYLMDSINALTNETYTKTGLLSLVNKVYENIEGSTPESRNNDIELYKLMTGNWLILPARKSKEEDGDYQNWKSRDISPQTVVHVLPDEGFLDEESSRYFSSWRERYEFDITNGITMPLYEFHREVRNINITKSSFQIGLYDKEELFIVNNKFYDGKGMGLCFDENFLDNDKE